MLSKTRALGSAVTVALLVTACGGGSGGGGEVVAQAGDTPTGGGAPVANTTVPEGLYTGTTDTDRAFGGFVLDDGSYYMLYSMQGNPTIVEGAVQGSGSAANGTFTSSNARDLMISDQVRPASLSASYVLKQSFNGTLTYGPNETVSFQAAYDAEYEKTPTLAALAGTYTGTAGGTGGVENVMLTVSSSGEVTATGESGCSASGTAMPRAKGNVFNVSITFGGAPCLAPNLTLNGIAYYEEVSRTVTTVTMSADRNTGLIFLGDKP